MAPHDATQPIEVGDDSTSDYSEEQWSDTTTLASSIVNYVYENGRRYHRLSEGKYMLPNDESEQDRLDLYHHSQLLLLKGELFLAPVGPLHRVLDCGTGTGIWALDVGERFRSAEVIGVDLSAIQPAWVFPNVKFEVDDLEKDWTYPKNHFDLIHSRTISHSIRDWPRYIKQIYEHTAPGGYAELAEHNNHVFSDDGTYTPETAIGKYYEVYHEACDKAGLTFPTDQEYKQWMEDAGFVDVKIVPVKQPWGGWPKNKQLRRFGLITAMVLEKGFAAYSLALMTRYVNKTEEEVHELCKGALEDITSGKVHVYAWMYHIYGRKPEAS